MGNLLVFALIGLLAATAARMLYPGRQPMRILGTMALGVGGALAGGMISWGYWPAVDGQFQSGNLLLSLLGAMAVIVLWAAVAYARSVSGSRNTSP
jgi:uncharacterized membrane protein YeaQ/YmgE (transglycosylase-associated protein family)